MIGETTMTSGEERWNGLTTREPKERRLGTIVPFFSKRPMMYEAFGEEDFLSAL